MQMTSRILQTAMHLILPLSLLMAAFAAMKGHNAPGGGFIAGLIASVAFCTYRMANGPEAFFNLLPVHPRTLLFWGLSLALIDAVVPLFFGLPLLTSRVGGFTLPGGEEIHYASAMIFDLGVLLVVVGVATGMITRLSEELEA